MMRQRELVLRRQTEAAKSFGVQPSADMHRSIVELLKMNAWGFL